MEVRRKLKLIYGMRCTAWVHGIHPQRLSFFTDSLYRLIEELGVEGVEGYKKVGIEEEKIFEDGGAGFEELLDESCEEIETEGRDSFVEEPLSSDGFFLSPAPPELGRGTGRYGASPWRRARNFFNDLANYWIEKKSVTKLEFWQNGNWRGK